MNDKAKKAQTTRRRREAESNLNQHVGKWMLIDSGKLQLLSIGSALYQGISSRTVRDPTARQVLIPQMRNAATDNQERGGLSRYGGRVWRSRVVPLLTPLTKQPVAVLGCYVPEHAELPPLPLVGSWEWRITPPGPGQQMRSYWSPALYDIYDIPQPGSGEPGSPPQSWWEGAQWFDELILDSDRAEVRRVVDGAIHFKTDDLFFQTYRVRSQKTGKVHRIRGTGRRYFDQDSDDTLLRGVSVRIEEEATTTGALPSTAGIMDAAFALSNDPLCAIDNEYENIYLTSPNFAGLGIECPPDRFLPTMAHPEDMGLLRNFLADVLARPGKVAGPVHIRFVALGGGWRTVVIRGTGMQISSGAHHVLCRMNVAEPVSPEWSGPASRQGSA
jgi:hypothetical protein